MWLNLNSDLYTHRFVPVESTSPESEPLPTISLLLFAQCLGPLKAALVLRSTDHHN